MESLRYLKEYIEGFHSFNFDKPIKYSHVGLTFSGKNLFAFISLLSWRYKNEKDFFSYRLFL